MSASDPSRDLLGHSSPEATPVAPVDPLHARRVRHLDRLRSLARVLDDLAPIPGTSMRVGLDPVLGLVPGLGDAVTGSVAAYAIVVAQRLGAPPSVLARMAWNVVLDLVFGAVPFVGDLFDFGWKASRKNVRLVERYAREPEAVKASSGLLVAGLIALLVGAVVGAAWTVVWVFRTLAAGPPPG